MKRLPLILFLLAIFLLSMGLNYGLLLHHASAIDRSTTDYSDIFGAIVRTHSTYIGLLLGGIFALKQVRAHVPLPLAGTAIALSLAWAALVASAWYDFPFVIGAKQLVDLLNQYAQMLAFLVAGMLAYLIGSDHAETRSAETQAQPAGHRG
jgi:hypothetical protein